MYVALGEGEIWNTTSARRLGDPCQLQAHRPRSAQSLTEPEQGRFTSRHRSWLLPLRRGQGAPAAGSESCPGEGRAMPRP